jgi:hypothetical protein
MRLLEVSGQFRPGMLVIAGRLVRSDYFAAMVHGTCADARGASSTLSRQVADMTRKHVQMIAVGLLVAFAVFWIVRLALALAALASGTPMADLACDRSGNGFLVLSLGRCGHVTARN